MTRYKLDGTSLPSDPLNKRWTRTQIAQSGVGEPIYTDFWQCELSFGILNLSSDVPFLEGRWLAGGLHTAVLAHPKTGVMTGFTGVAIQDFSYEFMDVESDDWANGARMLLSHISLSATGTV